MKPKILIVAENGLAKNWPHFMINLSYGEAVSKAGGLPIVALNGNCLEEYADMCDGLLLTDGPLVLAPTYGEIYNPDDKMPEIDRSREAMETFLIKRMTEKNKSVLGINRGMNLLNAFFGGTLEVQEGSERIKELAKPLTSVAYDGSQITAFKHESLKAAGVKCTPDNLNENIFEEFVRGIEI